MLDLPWALPKGTPGTIGLWGLQVQATGRKFPRRVLPMWKGPFYFEKLNGSFRLFMDPEGRDWEV